MLERYQPRKTSLRDKARANQLQSFLQQPDPRLFEQARKRRQEAEFRKRVKEIEAQVPEVQTSLEIPAAEELRKPAGGTEAELGLEQVDKRNPLAKWGSGILEQLDRGVKKTVSAIAHLGTTDIPFSDKTPFELMNMGKSIQGRTFQLDALNDLGKQMREQGITASDHLPPNPFNPENLKKTKEELQTDSNKVVQAYDKSDIGDYGNVNDAIELGLNSLGISTVDDKGILDDLSTLFNPLKQAERFGESNAIADVNKKLAMEAILKGEPIPSGLTNIPETSKKLGLELTYDPLHLPEIAYLAKISKGKRLLAPKELGAEILNKSKSADGLTVPKVQLNPDEAGEVLSYGNIYKFVNPDDLPTRAGFEAGPEVSKVLGYTRHELKTIYEDLFSEISRAKYFDQERVRKSLKINPDSEAVTFVNGKLRNLEESEKFLKDLNNLLVNDEVIGKISRGIMDDATNVRYGAKGPRSNFDKAGDIDLNAKNLYDTPKASTILTGKGVTGRVQRLFYSFISPRARIAGNVFNNFGDNPSEFLEGAHQVWLQQTRAIPDLIEKSPGFAELKRIGSPIEFDPTTGVTKIGNTEITQQLLKSLGIKVPKTTEDGRLILPTSDFLGKFFTTQGDQQYWKILVATGNPNIKNAGDAMLTPTGKWIKKYQNMVNERMEEVFARNIKGYDRKAFIPGTRGESYIGRIPARLVGESEEAEKILLAGGQYDPSKVRVVPEEELQNFIKEGGRYQNDPFDIMRGILNSTYKAQFDDELTQRAFNISALKFTSKGRFAGRKMLEDGVKELQDKITNPKADVFTGRDYNSLTNHFPELKQEIDLVELLAGTEKPMAFREINRSIEKLKKDPNSAYRQRLKQIEQVAKDTKEFKNQYASFIKMTDAENAIASKNIKRSSREKIAKALGVTEVEGLESQLSLVIKEYAAAKAFVRGANGILKFTEKVGNAMKGIYANLDLAAPLLQGQFILARDPKGWATGTKLMVDSLKDEKIYYQFIANHTDTIQKMIDGGIPLGARTSDFFYLYNKGGKDFESASLIAKALGKITGQKYVYKSDIPLYASTKDVGGKIGKKLQGTYSDPLDAYKILTYEAYEPLAKSLDEIEDLNHFIRASSGSMDIAAMGIGQTQQSIENALAFFSPRLFRGVTALSVDVFRGGLRGDLAREAWAKLAMGQIILMKELSDITGGELNLDPSSGGFASIKMPTGETVGFSQTLTPVFRMLSESAEISMDSPEAFTDWDFWKAGKTTGEGGRTIYNPYSRTVRSKSSVIGGSVWDIATGEDFFGYDITPMESLAKLAVPVPFSIQGAIIDDINRASREPDFNLAGLELDFYWLQALDPLGVKQYPRSNWDELYHVRDEIAARRFPSGVDKMTQWKDLSELQKAGLANPPSEILEGLSEDERTQIENDASILKQVADKVYAEAAPNSPDFMEEFYEKYNEINQKHKFDIEALTEELKQGNLASSPLQYESALKVFKNKRKELLNKKYDRIDELITNDVEAYQNQQRDFNVENTMKYYVDLYMEKVFDNPEFDLANGEFDYQALKQADRLFLQNDLGGNKELYDQIVSIRFQKKDLNDFEAELVLGSHIFGSKFFEGADQATLAQYPDVERKYYDNYQSASNDFKRVLREEDPRLAEFISVRNKVRENLRINDPYLDAWVYRNGYDNKLLSDAWLIVGEQNPTELYSWRDISSPVDWTYLMRNRKELFPEYY